MSLFRNIIFILALPVALFAASSPCSAIEDIPQACAPSNDRDSFISITRNKLVIGNKNVEAWIDISPGSASPSVIIDKINAGRISSAEEFSFTMMDGEKVSSSEFKYAGRIPQEFDGGRCKLTISYTNPARAIDAQVVFWLVPNSNLLRKYVRLKASGGEPHIDSLTIGNMKPSENATGGGFGQPVFFDALFFAGLEHPAGYNTIEDGTAAFTHYPGWELSGEWRKSKTLVVGAAAMSQAKGYFDDYVKSIRLKPRPFTVYNSWFDVRREAMSEDVFKRVFDEYKRGLSPYGVSLDSFVIDDGWQDKNSLWAEDKSLFPDGLAGLSSYLRANGSSLGLWLPLCGYGLSLPFSNKDGFEAAPGRDYFCLAGGKYRAALKKSLAHLIIDYGVNYLKHDFNFLQCKGSGPGMMPTARQSLEANTDAQIDLLTFMRSLNPDIFLNVTSYMWLSPWWLPYADALWIGSSDYGYSTSVPVYSARARSSAYYDEFIYKRLRAEGAQFPLYALMTHGIIDGSHQRLGGTDESFMSWSDNAMLYFARGVMMRELYLTPSLMVAEKWDSLGRMLKWASHRTALFETGRMLGADPASGNPWLYQFDDGVSDLFTVRNAGYRSIAIPLYLKHPSNLLRFDYPIRMYVMPHLVGTISGQFDFDMFDNETAVLESVPLSSLKRPAVLGTRAMITRQTPDETDYEVAGMPSKFVFKVASPINVREVLFNGESLEKDKSGYYHAEHVTLDPEQAADPMSTNAFSNNNPFSSTIDIVASSTRFMAEPKMIMTLRTASHVAPAMFELDGELMQATVTGNGWSVVELPLYPGTEIHQIRFDPGIISKTPFASSSFFVDFIFTGYYRAITDTITIRHDPAPEEDDDLPPAPMQGLMKYMSPSFYGELYDFSGILEKRTFPEGSTPRAAKLFIRVLGSKPEGVPSVISINGAPAVPVPYTSYPHENWENFTIDIPQTALRAVKKTNRISVGNTSGAGFKYTSLALSVQLDDGSWLNTPFDNSIQSTGMAAQQDKPSSAATSKPVTLVFP